jgi:hypothetical protein
VRDARQDEIVEITQDRIEGLALLRRLLRQSGSNLTRLHLRSDGKFLHALHVAGDPVDDLMPVSPELARLHVEGILLAAIQRNWRSAGGCRGR